VGPDSPIPNTNGYNTAVLNALRELKVPLLRWPGGCFADEYHWKDGIGPMDKRPSMYNSNWGGVVENNHFGTNEFLNMCEMLGIEPYICLNIGSGTVQEAQQWIEYMTSDAKSPMADLRRANGREKAWKVHYIAVGNEAWGCGGEMRPEFYADNFRRYNAYIKNYQRGPENKLYRVACGASGDDYGWTDTVMKIAGQRMDGISLHYYTIPTGDWKEKGSATNFGRDQYFATLGNTLRIKEMIERHSAIMDKYDPEKRVGLAVDEWGIWTDVEPGTNPSFLFQQNSMRDAVLAALNLHIFQAHADRVAMANIAQMVNVLQAMILTDHDKIVLTPTYHVFEMLNVHQGATSLPIELSTPDLPGISEKIPTVSASASRDASGKIHLSLVNTSPDGPVTVGCSVSGAAVGLPTGRVLTAPQMTSHNTFEAPNAVEPVPFTGTTVTGGKLSVVLPPLSVVILEI
jgi:alpha-N-arabinofuranosidase